MSAFDYILTAFDLPPAEAQEYLKKKGVTVTKAWNDITSAMHARSFTVAGVAGAELLEDLKKELESAMAEGETWQDFKKSVRSRLGDMGWSSEKFEEGDDGYAKVADVPAWRWELIYRQNMQTALQAGRYLNQKALAEVRPYLQMLVIEDNRSSSICPQYANIVAPADSSIWASIYPPNHFRCRSRVRSLSQSQLEREGLIPLDDAAIKVLVLPPSGFDVSPVEGAFVNKKRYSDQVKEALEEHLATYNAKAA